MAVSNLPFDLNDGKNFAIVEVVRIVVDNYWSYLVFGYYNFEETHSLETLWYYFVGSKWMT